VTDLSLVRTSEHMAMGMAWWWVGGCACAEQTLHLQSSSSSLHGLASCCWWRECPLDCRGRASMQHDRTGPFLLPPSLPLSLTSLKAPSLVLLLLEARRDNYFPLVLSSSPRCCYCPACVLSLPALITCRYCLTEPRLHLSLSPSPQSGRGALPPVAC